MQGVKVLGILQLDRMPCAYTVLAIFLGVEGWDWNYYVTEELYWRKWVELNRN